MNRIKLIKNKLKILEPYILDVIDNSAAHQNHIGHSHEGDNTHISLKIGSDKLNQLGSMVKQHRYIKTLLKDEFDTGLHALSINIIK